MLRGGRRCRSPLVVILTLGVAAPSSAHEYCAPHHERPCWGVRKTLSEATAAGPFAGITVGRHPSPEVVDWDGDGLVDVLLGADDGTVAFFRGGADGSLSQQTGEANPFSGISVESHSSPEVVDWDGDGRLDMLLGAEDGTVHFFQGGANGDLSQQMGVANPFANVRVGQDVEPEQYASPEAVDWDGDGHLDLLLGGGDGTVHYYRGNADGNLVLQTGEASPFADINVWGESSPEAVDWDGDGRWDLVVGSSDGTVRLYRSSADGSLSQQLGAANPFADLGGLIKDCKPKVVDWDSDGRVDLLLGAHNGTASGSGITIVGGIVLFYRGGVDGRLSEKLGAANPVAGADVGASASASPRAVDWDRDGRLDLLVGGSGTVHFYRGDTDGSLLRPTYAANPFKDIEVGPPSTPEAVDWDGDGHLDLLLGAGDGTVHFYRGSADGNLSQQRNAANPFNDIDVGVGARPEAVDWDGDGHLDLLLGSSDGTVRFYRGNANGSLSQLTDVANPFKDVKVTWYSIPKAVDWDGDGHLDLLLGVGNGTVRFYQGDADGNLTQQTGAANPFDDIFMGLPSTPEAADWDGDGHLDLLLGDSDGRVHFFSAQCVHTSEAEVCSYAGVCQHAFGGCECVASNGEPGASDCSICTDFFYKRTSRFCQPCPGEGTSQGPCSRRGTCWDSKAAREAQRDGAWTPAQAQAPGNGTCACEAPFSGDDCGQGECPPGNELTLTDTHVKRSSQYPIWETCTACAAGQYKATAGNTQCSPCTPGRFQSTSGAVGCDQCPQGKRQPLNGSSFCEDCEAGTTPNSGQTTCEVCSAGRHALPGQQNCSTCPAGLVPTDDRSDCQPCAPGSTPSDDQTACRPCSAGRYAAPGQQNCSLCQAGLVPAANGSGCQLCGSGFVAAEGDSFCNACPVFLTSGVGSSTCTVHWAVRVATGGALSIALALCLWFTLRCLARRNIKRTMQGGSADKLREALEWGSFVWLNAETQPAKRQLHVLEKKYVDYEYLLKIVEEGDLKLIKGSWLANKHNSRRLKRRQDLPPEAVWTVDELRGSLHAVLFVAVSYCWLHEVHPDPSSTHLRTLRHAIRLRLGLRGPGQIIDIALFLDYCSLAQHGEKGDPEQPERGDMRTAAEQKSFSKGLRHVNIPYANQAVEVWKMQYTPDNEPRTYMERGWPYFEQAVAALIKDAGHLLRILPESQQYENWLQLHEAALEGRTPPLTPAQFNQQLEKKTFTSPGTDKELVIRKYEETFHDVLGHATILWFTNLGWGDEEAAQLAQVLPFCDSLLHLYLGSNRITEVGAAALAAAAGSCPVRSMDLLGNPIASSAEAQLRRQWQGSFKAPDLLRMDIAETAEEVLQV